MNKSSKVRSLLSSLQARSPLNSVQVRSRLNSLQARSPLNSVQVRSLLSSFQTWLLRVCLPLALLAALGFSIGLGVALLPAQKYSVEVTIVVRIPDTADAPEVLVRTTESLVTTRAVLELVSASPAVDLTPDQVEDRIDLERSPGSTVIDITVTDADPDLAEAISVGLLPAMTDRIEEIQQAPSGSGSGGGGGQGLTFVPLQVTSPSELPEAVPVAREPKIYGVVGGAAGLVVGLLILLGRDHSNGSRMGRRDSAPQLGIQPTPGCPRRPRWASGARRGTISRVTS